MGATASTQMTDAANNLYASATSACTTTTAANTLNIDGSTLVTPPGCPGINITQVASVNADCVLTNIEQSMANAILQNASTTSSGLGITVDTTVNDIETTINTQVASACQGASTTNMVNMTNSTIDACGIGIDQTATAQTACEINTTLDAIANYDGSIDTDASGGSLVGDIFGSATNLLIFGAVIIAIIIAAIVAIVIIKSKSKKHGADVTYGDTSVYSDMDMDTLPEYTPADINTVITGGGCKTGSTIFLILMILILVIVLMYYFHKNNKSSKINNSLNNSSLNNSSYGYSHTSPYGTNELNYNNLYPDTNYDLSENELRCIPKMLDSDKTKSPVFYNTPIPVGFDPNADTFYNYSNF